MTVVVYFMRNNNHVGCMLLSPSIMSIYKLFDVSQIVAEIV